MTTTQQRCCSEQTPTEPNHNDVFHFLSGRLPIRDLTKLARNGRLQPAIGEFQSADDNCGSTGSPIDLFSFAAKSLSRQHK